MELRPLFQLTRLARPHASLRSPISPILSLFAQNTQQTPRRFSTNNQVQEPLDISTVQANGTRLYDLIHHTAQWGAENRYGTHDHHTGLSRLALSNDDCFARDWLVNECRSLGCEITVDQIGNIFAVKPGRRRRVAMEEGRTLRGEYTATFVGSHLDSQPTGGRYDGVLGVCAGVEMLRVFRERGVETEGDLGVVNWTNEEGARWGISMMGSGVWAGARDLHEVWELEDQMEGHGRGESVYRVLDRIDYLGEHAVGEGRFPMAGHFELHIEQAKVLESMGRPVGVVQGVQGYVWLEIVVKGRESHAGTTALADRADPVTAAAKIIGEVPIIAQHYGGLGTVGCIDVKPGSINTIPGEVRFTVDLRHAEEHFLHTMMGHLNGVIHEVSMASNGVTLETKELFSSQPILFDERAMECVEQSAKGLQGHDGSEIPKLTSGAGHDSVHTSKICPTAMIFVPCKDGLSHHPREYASMEDCQAGATVLMQSVLHFDRGRVERGELNEAGGCALSMRRV